MGLLFLILETACSNHASSQATLTTDLQKYLDQWRVSYHLPGAAMTVIIPGQNHSPDQMINLQSGVANLETKAPIAPETLFQICSITKTYTAVLILKLEQEHQLSINQTIGDWLPEYPQWSQVTIKQLLNMTSGIPSYTNDPKFNQAWQANPEKYWTPQEALNFVKDKPFLYTPGSGWNYDDANYVLLGLIIEKASGKTYEQNLQDNILKPLGLTHTYYVPYAYSDAWLKRLATGYSDKNQVAMNVNMSQANAAGAMIATTQDTAMFVHDLFSGEILNQQEMSEMLTAYSATTGKILLPNDHSNGFGLGMNRWWLEQEQSYCWFKPGGFVGFFDYVFILNKNKIVIMIAANQWSDKAFMGLPRVFAPELYQMFENK